MRLPFESGVPRITVLRDACDDGIRPVVHIGKKWGAKRGVIPLVGPVAKFYPVVAVEKVMCIAKLNRTALAERAVQQFNIGNRLPESVLRIGAVPRFIP